MRRAAVHARRLPAHRPALRTCPGHHRGAYRSRRQSKRRQPHRTKQRRQIRPASGPKRWSPPRSCSRCFCWSAPASSSAPCATLQNQDYGFERTHLLLADFNAKLAGYKPSQTPASASAACSNGFPHFPASAPSPSRPLHPSAAATGPPTSIFRATPPRPKKT